MTTSIQQETTRERIVSLLRDGKPRTLAELHRDCSPLKFSTVRGAFERMQDNNEIEVAAGFAAKPSNGPTARRYLLAEGVKA